ncbi:hypothetical protein LXA43DRAFT_976766 [Ganoderma leucocontextum]|nr:hypothetical protein LXA43DRAFT_976766 [Ganoderma leucocontextum]
MGVSGLWEIINKASQTRSVAHLALVDGFERNEHGTRSLRIGVDASLWLQHVTTPHWMKDKNPNAANARANRVGDNPELRTLFFKLARWSKLPVSLLFVFDGRERPKVKRGSRMGKSGSHPHARGFRELIDLFGWDSREARGEAEAELAFLNQVGAIDAVVTDDIDCLIFGARMILKNFSLNLSGNKADPPKDANGKSSDRHARVYTADEIQRHPDVRLTRGGLVLFALMSGGDYDEGLFRCGPSMAHAMARQQFGDDLLAAYEQHRGGGGPAFVLWLEQWRQALQTAIRANSQGLMARAAPNFLATVELYVRPLTSASGGGQGGGPPRTRRAFDLPGLAWWCEKHFEEWGYKSALLKRFNSQLTGGLVLHVLRHAALEADRREKDRQVAQGRRPGEVRVRGPLRPQPHEGVGTSAALVKACLAPKAGGGGYAAQRDIDMEALRSAFVRPDTPEPKDRNADMNTSAAMMERVEDTDPLIVEITRTREHVSTDELLEYRVKVCPRQIISIAESGVRGMHPEPGPRKRAVKFAEDEPDDTDEEGGGEEEEGGNGRRKKKRGKKTDPNDDVLLWIPAMIMRQDWEQRRGGGGRAGGANANAAPRQGAAAAPQSAAPAAPQVYPQAALQAVYPAAIPPPAVAPPPAQPAPAAPQRVGRGKGKARARPNDEYDYLAINPYASAAPPQHDFNPMADTSLPFRVCGFMFSWPDPDDPDRLIVDTDERDDLPTMVNYRDVESAGVFGEYGSSARASQGAPRTQARARASATSSARRAPAQVPRAHPSEPASRSDDTAVGMSVDDSLATIVAAASAPGANRNQSQRNAARPRKRKENDYHAGQNGDDDVEPWVEPEDDGSGRNRYSRHALEIDRLLGIGADGEPIPIPKRKGKARGRKPRAPPPPTPPTTTSASAERGRGDGKGKERADRETSKAKRRKTVHEDAVQPTRSTAASGPSTGASSASTFRRRADPLFLELDSDSSRSPSPFNVLRSSSPAPLPPSSAFPTPSTSRSLARNVPLPPSSSPCAPKQRGPDVDVISISSDSEDEPIADTDLSGDDWLRNYAPFNGTPSVYSQRKARESQRSESLRTAPTDVDSDAEDDGAMDLDLESVLGSQSMTLVAGDACRQAFSSSASSAPPPYLDVPLRSSFRDNAPFNIDGDTEGDFFQDVTVVRSLR